MKKFFNIVLVTSCVAIASTVFAVDNGPEKIDINAQKTAPDVIHDKDKKHATFPHKAHQDGLKGLEKYSMFKYADDWTCGACHHTSKKGEQPTTCFKCKDVAKMIEKVGGEKKWNNIFHKPCKDCHSKMDKDKVKTGPTKCKGCHPKK